jgi:hypothetical protein
MAIHIDDDDGAKDYYFEKDNPVPFSTMGSDSIFPLTFSCWCKPDAINDHDGVISIGNASSTAPVVSLNLRASGYATAEVKVSAGTSWAQGPRQYQAEVWQHFCAVFASSTSRYMYQDGTAGSEQTTSRDIDGDNATKLSIGEYASTWNRELNGHIADCAIWNVALTASEIATLADGYTAIQVRPDSLVSYYPLVRDYLDVMGNNLLTFDSDASATEPTFSEHTRIIEDVPMPMRGAWGGI